LDLVVSGPVTAWSYSDEGGQITISSRGRTRVSIDRETGAVSDGFHTFEELYRYRLLYNAALFNEWAHRSREAGSGWGLTVHKSWRHHDGEVPFGDKGWFIVVATLPTGQISNHYEAKHWDLFQIPVRDRADEWDGHTPEQAADRLERWLKATF
jgi:hypothetical protein